MVALSFLIMIFVGTGLLCLPFAVKGGNVNFLNALFTATSASCVTGLVIADTFTHWTYFGQAVILILIQIGGMGFITIVSLFTVYTRKRASLSTRKLAMQSAGGVSLMGVRSLLKVTLIGVFAIEFIGSFVLCFAFVPVYGWGQGIWQSVFTAISAFCNAGFTITDAKSGYSSLLQFIDNPIVLITVALLIIIGGIGFFVWGDVVKFGIRFKKYSLHSKLALTVTGALLLGGWALFLIFEWNNPSTLGEKSVGIKILASFFLAVTPRTAGFNIVNYSEMTAAGSGLTVILMFIGGSPGSTAGGIKTVTLAVCVLSLIANCHRYEEIHIFNRRLENEAPAQASAVVCLYIMLAVLSVIIISAIEVNSAVTLEDSIFEVVSAIATVGLTRGITPTLHVASKLILVFLMYLGRLGGFTIILIFGGEKKPVPMSRVPEKLLIG